MQSIIKSHNTKVLEKQTETPENETDNCNCRNKEACPLGGNCLSKCMVYKATVTSESREKVYYGMCEGDFKARYRNHIKSFNNERYKNETSLSTHIWSLKTQALAYDIKWLIVQQAKPYSCGSHFCNLCLTEKFYILTSKSEDLLNKRSEIISKCRHRRKFLLSNPRL